MATQIDFQSLIDIGFVVLVTVACLRTFVRDGSGSEARRHAWRTELKELEGALRGLIEEAAAASRNLDRNLGQRKRELEDLLKKMDGQSVSTAGLASASAAGRKVSRIDEDELPNESWLKSPTASTANRQPSHPARSDLTGLESLIEQADDTVSLSQRVTREVLRQQAESQARRGHSPGAATRSALHSRYEEENKPAGNLDPFEEETFRQTSIMDPVTYRIARRLLKSGKELHVVARKVELPVAEIRLLDRLLREEDKKRMPPVEQPPVTLREQIETLSDRDEPRVGNSFSRRRNPRMVAGQMAASGGARDATALDFEQMTLKKSRASKDSDLAIERESALL